MSESSVTGIDISCQSIRQQVEKNGNYFNQNPNVMNFYIIYFRAVPWRRNFHEYVIPFGFKFDSFCMVGR